MGSCLLAFARAAPAAEAEADADAQYLTYAAHTAPLAHAVAAPAVAPVAYHAATAPTCVTEDVILVTQVCTPTAEEVCSTETVATQEIEYEKKCTEIVDTLCDAPVAHAVAHYGTETVKHACREVTTEHCVDNPKVIEVPVEVEHCHTVTKVTCADVENKLPKTTCEAVIT